MSDAAETKTPILEIDDLHVAVEGTEILKGVSLTVMPGETHVLMGRNGSGKSTLSSTIMGHPRYEVTGGRIRYCGEDLLELEVHERARKGVFLCFQYPTALPGVSVNNFLRQSVRAVRGDAVPPKAFRPMVKEQLKFLQVPRDFMTRYVNDGFSGGEKKRLEILQMLCLQPKLAVLDETDSGLDIDALKLIASGINTLRSPERGQLLITHYQRILDHVKPDRVHVMIDGEIVRSGGADLAHELEEKGYDWLDEKAAKPAGSTS
jgi:Fe-S cluster assembly ATP-binding protein